MPRTTPATMALSVNSAVPAGCRVGAVTDSPGECGVDIAGEGVILTLYAICAGLVRISAGS
jgi:hypothetical protein